MMYPFMKLNDETEITHSQILVEGGVQKVEVYFERPTENGFDCARAVLPDYKWLKVEGYTQERIDFFDQLLRANAHLFYKYAAQGGVKIA